MAAGKNEPKATSTSAGGFKLKQPLPLKLRSLILLHTTGDLWRSLEVLLV